MKNVHIRPFLPLPLFISSQFFITKTSVAHIPRESSRGVAQLLSAPHIDATHEKVTRNLVSLPALSIYFCVMYCYCLIISVVAFHPNCPWPLLLSSSVTFFIIVILSRLPLLFHTRVRRVDGADTVFLFV